MLKYLEDAGYVASTVIKDVKSPPVNVAFTIILKNWVWHCHVIYNDLHYFGGDDGMIRVYDDNFNLIRILECRAFPVYCLIVHNGFLYSGGDRIRVWDKNGFCVKMMSVPMRHISQFAVYNGLLYSINNLGGYIYTWDQNHRCVQSWRSGMFTYGVSIYQDRFYVRTLCSIHEYGEYYPHRYHNLPTEQKDKIKNWRKTFKPAQIHKDISLLFQRELLL